MTVPPREWTTPGCATSRSSADLPHLAAAVRRIDAAGQADFDDSYAGVEIDEPEIRAIVHRVPSARFDTYLVQAAGDACIVVRDAAHSLAELTALQTRIAADLPLWHDQGVRISTVGARHDGSGVHVGTQDAARARRELPARYGADAPILVVDEGPVFPY
jgi:hypothetical protein